MRASRHSTNRRVLPLWQAACLVLVIAPLPALSTSNDNEPLQLAQAIAAADIAGYNAAPDSHRYRRELIGYFIDGREQDGLFAVSSEEQFLLPLEAILKSIGADLVQEDGTARVTTPAGEVPLDPQQLHTVDDNLMIDIEALNRALHLDARFDRSNYAVYLSPPWDQRASARSNKNVIQADFTPPKASLRNLRADFTHLRNDEESETLAEYFAAGNLARGTWQTRVEQDRDDELTPFDYYWHRAWEQQQLLLGNASYSLHPLVPSIEQTGAQAIYSNQGFGSDASRDLIAANGPRDIGTGTRRIAGVAEPGSIAQLRVNGGILSRTRVRLDGTYEFSNVDVPSRANADIRVLIIDRNSGVLIETQDFTQRGGAGLLAGQQHTLFVAAGEEGNSLDDRTDSRGTSAAGQWRYGVNERLTVELGHQYDGNTDTTVAGTYLALGNNFYSSLAYAEADETDSLEFTLDGGSGPWESFLSMREYWEDDPDEKDHQWVRYGTYEYQVNRELRLGMAGRDEKRRSTDEQFALPTLRWSDGDLASFSAWPNTSGNYRVDTRLTPTRKDKLAYTFEEDNHFVDYRHRTGRSFDIYANYREGDDFDARGEVGIIAWTDNPLLDQVQFGVVGNDDEVGYIAQWDAHLAPGLYSQLRVSDNAYRNDSQDVDPGLAVVWDVTLDFAVNRGRLIPADSGLGRVDSAALVGPVMVNGEPARSDMDIRQITLVINGVSRSATVQGGQYYVDGLTPGLHRVTIDTRHMPIEMVPTEGQQYWVELARAAATSMPVELELRYAAAGRVRNAAGEPASGVLIRLVDTNGQVLTSVLSDQFGFYRVDNLAPGRYRAEVVRDGDVVAARNLSVSNDFLFDQDLVIIAPGAAN